MSILLIDDEHSTLTALRDLLTHEGYSDIHLVRSGPEAIAFLRLEGEPQDFRPVDLILLDLVMAEMNGKEVCRRIKSESFYQYVPVIMLTGRDEIEELNSSFAAGAVDYIVKPANKLELLARIQAHLRLKNEIDHRREREETLLATTRQLQLANQNLAQLTYVDGLTQIKNRRYFDETYEKEWRRALRQGEPVALLMIDIDYFKLFNDTFGHQGGDQCLRQVAVALHQTLRRPADFVCRYGGEEFVAVLPHTALDGALVVAESIMAAIAACRIGHRTKAGEHLTISLGAAAEIPKPGGQPGQLFTQVDKALYRAKNEGRNRIATL